MHIHVEPRYIGDVEDSFGGVGGMVLNNDTCLI